MASIVEERSAADASESLFDRLGAVLPIVDLTEWAAESSRHGARPVIPGTVSGHKNDQILRTLYQQPPCHVLLTGAKGVGKTTIVQALALRGEKRGQR